MIDIKPCHNTSCDVYDTSEHDNCYEFADPSSDCIYFQDEIITHSIKRKAKMWDALMNSGRIRLLGSSGLGSKDYQHMGIDIWSTYPDQPDNTPAKEALVTYVETIIKNESDNTKS